MAEKKSRSACPISCALEIFGDKWTLLIVRDIAFFGKNTYNEFLKSDEGIATNILASRLAGLEAGGIIARKKHPASRAKIFYELTPKGAGLVPVLLEISLWADAHLDTPARARDFAAAYRENRAEVLGQVAAQLNSGKPLA
ncbi:transcriptional regulator [Pedobacter yulinensis]|uniref:Transcriptional regulator n=1 Tax=Pedobacter yulinensis TaxID=2126353 RepID=A0A2T3HMH5_9SPHI|nr:helix-turn-helix domain-containing protein [Pedobacter yulinensis]PST83637.1 transcriptional regulator [Pedobacter yulinensis]